MYKIVNTKQGRLVTRLVLLGYSFLFSPPATTGGATSTETGVSFPCHHTEHGGSEEEGAGGGRRKGAHEGYCQRDNGGLGERWKGVKE